jgi:hypothetical protein
MAEYALVADGNVIRRFQDFEGPPQDPLGKPGLKWLPVARSQSPAYDALTQRLVQEIAFSPTLVSITYTAIDKDANQLDQSLAAELAKIGAVLKVLIDHEQRLRALEGKPALTKPQIINGLKQLLTT